MSLHDAYGRITPYEISIPGRAFAAEWFGKLEKEAEDRGVDLGDPGAFLLLQSTGELLAEVRAGGEDPELLHQYGALFFHGYHFWRAGEPFLLVEGIVVRYLVDDLPHPEDWRPRAPGPAGYVQLPRHLFWAGPEGEEAPEPLDGFFWTTGGAGEVSVLVAMGVRDDRPGLSVAALPPLPLRDAPTWMRERARAEGQGEDFATTLPGGEIERLYSVRTTGEILKLAARTFWYLDRFPDAVGEEEKAGAEEEILPRPSTLPYRKVGLRVEAEGGG